MLRGRFGGSQWNEALHPRVPKGSGDPSGEWTRSPGAINEHPYELRRDAPSNGPVDEPAGPTPEYAGRTPVADAEEILGIHYSKEPRQTLISDLYGTGYRGAERDRLSGTDNSDIRPRTYFYVDKGSGVQNEDGVGGYAHRVRLTNIYNPERDGFKIWREGKDANESERAVLRHGYDGYYASFGNATQGMAVVIGHHVVPVKYIGQPRLTIRPGRH